MKIIISLQILNIDLENVDYNLIGNERDDQIIWTKSNDEEPVGPDYNLIIITDKKMKNIEDISVGAQIQTPTQDIKDAFLASLFEAYIVQQIDEADGFEHTHELIDLPIQEDINPYDPKLIRVDTKPFSIEHICKLINKDKLDISPDFQREFVWTEISRKSRLIESIMLRIPIPVFYLSQDDEGKYQVVDGIQRLTVINDFITNKFKLKNLEYLKDLEGKWFRNESRPTNDSIPPLYAGRIEDTQLFFNIIDPSTPERVKYDIFRRINTGGKTLNPQEIRNCLSNPKTRQLLKKMVELESFQEATRGSVSKTRMADKELALRFAGFYLLDTQILSNYEYKGKMSDFLDYVNQRLNKESKILHEDILNAFDNAMTNAFILFSGNAFRRTTYINKALFLSWSRQLFRVDSALLKNSPQIKQASFKLKDRIENDIEYNRSISGGTNDIWSIEKAYKVARKILEELLYD